MCALAVAGTTLIPVPLLDGLVEGYIRRRMTRQLFQERGISADPSAIATLSDMPGRGCLGYGLSVLIWPLKKLFKGIFFFLHVKEMLDLCSDVVCRGLLVEEALRRGWLPGDAMRVREAIDGALAQSKSRSYGRVLAFLLGRSDDGLEPEIVTAFLGAIGER